MATSDRCEIKATICATDSDNENPTTMTTLPNNTSDDDAQYHSSGEMMTSLRMVKDQESEYNRDKATTKEQKESSEVLDKDIKRPPLPFLRLRSFKREDSTSDGSEPRTPEITGENKENVEKESSSRPLSFIKVSKDSRLKREKSNPEILVRKKKRVKFSSNDDDDVMVDTHVFEPQVVSCFKVTEDEGDGDVSFKIKKLLKRGPKRKKPTIETQTEGEGNSKIVERDRLDSKDDGKSKSLTGSREIVHRNGCDIEKNACSQHASSPDIDSLTIGTSGNLQDKIEQPYLCTTAPECVIQEPRKEVEQWSSIQMGNRRSLSGSRYESSCCVELTTTNDGTNSLLSPENATLQEEQKLELNGCENKEEFDPAATESDLSASIKDDHATITSQGTIKRDGTFTLDGPPPAKITRSSCDVVEDNTLPQGNTPPRDSIMEPLHFFIDVRETGGKLDDPAVKVKERKPIKCVKFVEPEVKKQEEISSSVKSLKNTAKKTFACAWKTAVKSPDTPDKMQKPPQKPSVVKSRTSPKPESSTPRSSPTKPDTLQRSNSAKEKSPQINLQRKTTDPKRKTAILEKPAELKSPKESIRMSRTIKRAAQQDPESPSSPSDKASVWSGVSLSSFRREGTFTKDCETGKDKLQAECHVLSVEKERLQNELEETRRRLDDEVAARKALKRNNELSLRQLREGEIKRSETLIADLRNRLEDEKREALALQRESLQRESLLRTQEAKLAKDKDDEHRRILSEARLTEERLKTEIRRETLRIEQQQGCHASEKEVERLHRDLSTLREYKKRLEEAVQLDELRSKERSMASLMLEKQEEKTRGGGSSVSSKKQKNGTKIREKDSNHSSISTAINVSTTTSRSSNHSVDSSVVPLLCTPPITMERELLSTAVSPMEKTTELRISLASEKILASENDDLRHQLENAKKEVEDLLLKNNELENGNLLQQLEEAKQEVEDLLLKNNEQEKEIEQCFDRIDKQKEMIEDQQTKISELTEEAMDRECMVLSSQPVWPPKIIESCVKVSDLPTVMEQSSEEELSPTSSPTTRHPTSLHNILDDHTRPHTPTALLTPTTPGTEPLSWPQVHDNKFSSQMSRVCDEWQDLLASTSNPSSPIEGKDYLSGVWSSSRVVDLEKETSQLKEELQEAKDQADLLEFRVLELEGADRVSESGVGIEKVDQSTSTDLEELHLPPSTTEDLSLPLSIDSGLDISNDYKTRVTEGRAWLTQLRESVPDSPAAQHLAALLDWVATIPTHHGLSSPMSPTLTAPHLTPTPKMGGEEPLGGGDDIGRDLMILATRLQESLNDPAAQEPLLLDTIGKLRVLDASLSQLQERVVSLTEENRELQETVTTLSDAHETRTEASGTESELQLAHRKTPSFHSDMSDADESDSAEHAQQHPNHHHRPSPPVKLVSLEASTTFQESGIFDTSCEVVHVTTQTELTQMPEGMDVLQDPTLRLLGHKSECELREAEVDLQSAVARLSTIRSAVQGRDLGHLRMQELQESDEYLRTCLDERIVLSKLEYDSIVESERCLQREMEHLKCEKEQLNLDCEALREHTRKYKARCGTDAEESMKGEIRVLKQKLLVTERLRREVFEEKCEIEEEENDSRLRVQRLESQMDASREMENLLSASLSQEQEISRELHRRVRELQILEREHRSRLEKVHVVSRALEQKATLLAIARDQLAMQLSFATYGLILADSWRLMVPNPTTALVPYTGKEVVITSLEMYPTGTPPLATQTLDNRKSDSVGTTCDKCIHPPVVCDVCVQTYEFPAVSASVQTDIEVHSVGVQCTDEKVSSTNIASNDHCLRRTPERDDDEDEPHNKRPRSTRTQATMTLITSETPTELEQYYLEQIEALQREKISLRKGQETNRRDSLQQHSDLEDEMGEMSRELQEAKEDRCSIIFRLEETQDEQDELKQKYLHRIEELKGDMSRYKQMYEQERKSLQREFDARVKEIERERDCEIEKGYQLELKLSNFRQELEIVGISFVTDLVDSDSEMENMLSQGKISQVKCPDDREVLAKIRELVKSETTLRQKIYDLEKKECAYRETIREADKIMSSHVTSYKQRIEDLENTIDQQIAQIQQLESSEDRLRSSLRKNSRTSEGARISDLLDRLIETENSELKLKERVWNSEKSEKELQIKLMEGEKNHQLLRGELRDQEELIHRLRSLETENNALSVELSEAQDSARKMSEIQQSECYLRGRVEELEITENMLRETLHQADLILAQRERKLRDQVSSLQEEVQVYKAQLEAAASKEYSARECEVSYRRQLEELKGRLAEAEREIKESSSETMSHETQHRSEVTKLRNQLKLGNSQLTELDRLNCEMRDRVLAAEAEGQRLVKELEEQSRRHEQDLITFNLQLSSRDSRIEEMEHHLEQVNHTCAVSELDALASSPIASLHTSITALTSALKNCESCKETQSTTLTEVTTQLGTLAELLEGQTNSDNEDIVSDTDEEEPHAAENLAHSTPPPNPAGEGPRELSSGDVVSCSSRRLKRDSRRRSRRRLEEHRNRKLMYPQGSTTILEELEEKVRELEEAVGRKDDEIRLADNENCELNKQLQKRDTVLQQKSEEVENLDSTLASLRQQLMYTMEDFERSRLSLQTKHKVDFEQLALQVEHLTKEAERLATHGKLKDSIILTLASQIRAILRSGNMTIVINQLRRLQEVGQNDQAVANGNGETVTDFDVEAVCLLLNQPNEMVSLSQATLNGTESCHVTNEVDVSCHSQQTPSHPRGSPLLVDGRKSRIPRYNPSPSPQQKALPSPSPQQRALSTPLPLDENNFVKANVTKPRGSAKARMATETEKCIAVKPPHEQQANMAIESLDFKRHTVSMEKKPEPMEIEETNFHEGVKLSHSTESQAQMVMPSEAKVMGRKDSTGRERPARYLSDARKIKRMVTGVAPLDAAVDCAAAPEWRSRSPIGSMSEVETCIPRPQNLHITRRVGVDGVVIAWAPLEHDCVSGFQVLVGGRVVQHVRSPHRTKALVTGLPLAGSFTIGLVAVAKDGRCSVPVIVSQDRTRVYAARSSSERPLRRGVPTCL